MQCNLMFSNWLTKYRVNTYGKIDNEINNRRKEAVTIRTNVSVQKAGSNGFCIVCGNQLKYMDNL